MNVVGSKSVFKTKLKIDGFIKKMKSRLEAKRYHQLDGVDFSETFSLLIKPATIHLVLSLAPIQHWPFKQLDVKNTFMYRHFFEIVFMEQPPRFSHKTFPLHVCQLKKAIV